MVFVAQSKRKFRVNKIGCKKIVDLLIKGGANVNAMDFNGDTPLNLALNNGKFNGFSQLKSSLNLTK